MNVRRRSGEQGGGEKGTSIRNAVTKVTTAGSQAKAVRNTVGGPKAVTTGKIKGAVN